MRYTDRELPPYRHRPGLTPHPERDPSGHAYGEEAVEVEPLDPESWHTNSSYLFGVDLFNEGFYWEAHVEWERLWTDASQSSLRAMLQALIQLSAAMVKAREGHKLGVTKLLSRVRKKLRPFEPTDASRCLGLDLSELASGLERWSEPAGEDVELDSLLRLRLVLQFDEQHDG